MKPSVMDRRDFLQTAAAAGLFSSFGCLNLLRAHGRELEKRGMSMILLYMQGGPSQFETFDPKPGTANGGPTTAISTSVPGIEIAEGWNETAKMMSEIAVIRSMTNREGNHQRAAYQLHTGYVPSGSVKHPSLGCAIAKELADVSQELPCVVAVGNAVGAGFLGVDYEPFTVNNPGQMPQNVSSPVVSDRLTRRLGLLNRVQQDFAERGAASVVDSHRRLYEKTSRLVLSPQVQAFEISQEPAELRQRYGDSVFGRGCLLARRLVEAGVTFVEVSLGNWDTHQDNFNRTKGLIAQCDPGLGTLLADLKERGRLDKTVVVWVGEFGRTPRINPNTGRDHYPRVFNALLAGGGLRGGQAVGASTPDGTAVARDPVTVADFFATICKAMGVDAAHENMSPLGRPLKIVDGGTPIASLI